MDTSFLFLILIAVVLSLIALRNGKNSDLFTFPFLFPAVTVAFVLAEFSDFMLNAGVLYELYAEAGAVTIALFMIATCALFGLIGHAVGSRGAPRMAVAPELAVPDFKTVTYMHIASIALGGLSLVAFAVLTSLGGGFQEYVFFSGAYSIEWRGLPVYLLFVVRLCYVSIVIQLWLWVRTKRSRHLRWALLFTVIPLINIFFIFRRAEVIKIGIFYGYFLTNYRGWKIGRIPALGALVGMYLVFKLFPLLRSEEGKQRAINELVADAFVHNSYDNSEIGSGLLRIYQSMQTQTYEYGAIFYNAIISQFVPAGLVGAEEKAAMLLPTVDYSNTDISQFLFYISPMGFAQAYQQFWLLGGLIFFVLAFFMARLERTRFTNRRTEILLVLIVPIAVSTVSTDLSLFIPQLVVFMVMIWLCVPKQYAAAPVSTARQPVFG